MQVLSIQLFLLNYYYSIHYQHFLVLTLKMHHLMTNLTGRTIIEPTLNHSDVKSYRPVSLLQLLSQTVEHAVFTQLSVYLHHNNLLDPTIQTETALLALSCLPLPSSLQQPTPADPFSIMSGEYVHSSPKSFAKLVLLRKKIYKKIYKYI